MNPDWESVRRSIEEGEGQRIEFERELGNLSGVGRAICAFANTQGGLVIVGVDDAGELRGVREAPATVRERLTGFLQSGCSTPVPATCGMEKTPDGWVHWVRVPRVRGFEPIRHQGRFWVRRPRSSVEPSSTELQELFNTFGFVMTEQQVIPAGAIADIDISAFRAFMRAKGFETVTGPQPTTEGDLRNLAVVADHGGVLRPTLYGLMAFGKDPQAHPHTTRFLVQCAAYEGTDRASGVILVGEGRGRLEEQVRRSVGWARGLGWFESYNGIDRQDTPRMPLGAVREALVNAVIHRDYSITGSPAMLEIFRDRIDVTSPGTLPNHMTAASVRAGGGPRSRNELMASAMVVARLMEQRGRGWLLMRRAMREFNGTEPELVNDEGGRFVRVTFRLDLGARPMR